MDQNQRNATYLNILLQSLLKKEHILNDILELTKYQADALLSDHRVIEVMEECVEKKSSLITQLEEIDQGFDTLYARIQEEIVQDKLLYRSEIQQLQQQIKKVTELGVTIQMLEQNNKIKFEIFLAGKKKEIKQFKMSSRTVSTYYKNMTGTKQGESYFIDKKN